MQKSHNPYIAEIFGITTPLVDCRKSSQSEDRKPWL